MPGRFQTYCYDLALGWKAREMARRGGGDTDAAQHRVVCLPFERVVERGEQPRRIRRTMAPGEREREQVVGKMGILGQQRAVQVGAVGVVDHASLTRVLAVVAEASQHGAERLRA